MTEYKEETKQPEAEESIFKEDEEVNVDNQDDPASRNNNLTSSQYFDTEQILNDDRKVHNVDVDDDVEVAILSNGNDDDNPENGDEEPEENPHNKTKKRRVMKVPADASWSARMWEGAFVCDGTTLARSCVCIIFWSSCLTHPRFLRCLCLYSILHVVFTTFWPLGLIAFGGPQAHVAILRDHLVDQRDWLDEESFLELFAIGQGLPGPTSTQLVIATATSRAGPLGGLLAFFLWNLPGLVILTVCGSLIATFVNPNEPPWYLIGLPPAAIALVFKAFYGFAVKLDSFGIWLSLFACLVAVLINNDARISSQSSQWVLPATMAIGGIATFVDSKRSKPFSEYTKSPGIGWDRNNDETFKRIGIPLWVGALIFLVWLAVLVGSICLVNVAKLDNVYLGTLCVC